MLVGWASFHQHPLHRGGLLGIKIEMTIVAKDDRGTAEGGPVNEEEMSGIETGG